MLHTVIVEIVIDRWLSQLAVSLGSLASQPASIRRTRDSYK